MIAMFGTHKFEITKKKKYTFTDFQFSEGLKTEIKESAKGKSAVSVKNLEPAIMSFSVIADVKIGVNPKSEIDFWQRVLYSNRPQFFYINGGPILKNRFLLTGYDYTDVIIDKSGRTIKCSINLSFIEQTPTIPLPEKSKQKGSAKGKGNSSSKSKTKNTGGKSNITASNSYNVKTSTQDKSDKKR